MDAAFLSVLESHTDALIEALAVAPQTNEIGRSAALLPGLSHCIGSDRPPVRLFEIGASAGLNLLLDHFRYELGDVTWGDSAAEAVVRADWRGPMPRLFDDVDIVERRGCDVAPVDVTQDSDRIRTLSFVWADQLERFERMSAAIDVARRERPVVDRADAAVWVQRLLEPSDAGVHTVLQHSIMWQYLSDDTQQSINNTIEEAGARATSRSPFSHVRFEPPPLQHRAKGHALTVTTWPGGEERILAHGHAHGAWIEWLT